MKKYFNLTLLTLISCSAYSMENASSQSNHTNPLSPTDISLEVASQTIQHIALSPQIDHFKLESVPQSTATIAKEEPKKPTSEQKKGAIKTAKILNASSKPGSPKKGSKSPTKTKNRFLGNTTFTNVYVPKVYNS